LHRSASLLQKSFAKIWVWQNFGVKKKLAFCNIVLACCTGLGLVSCADPMQQSRLMDGLQGPGATTPKVISGPLLNKCVDKYRKWQNATFPEGDMATYSAVGVNAVATHHPPGPDVNYKSNKLVSYKIAISRRWVDPDNAYAFCYCENSNGNLKFLDSIETNGYGDINSTYLYNISAGIYEKLAGKKIYIRY
jgi:hypothetical protein